MGSPKAHHAVCHSALADRHTDTGQSDHSQVFSKALNELSCDIKLGHLKMLRSSPFCPLWAHECFMGPPPCNSHLREALPPTQNTEQQTWGYFSVPSLLFRHSACPVSMTLSAPMVLSSITCPSTAGPLWLRIPSSRTHLCCGFASIAMESHSCAPPSHCKGRPDVQDHIFQLLRLPFTLSS